MKRTKKNHPYDISVVVGGFYGDEGKGKIVSYLATSDNPDVIVRGGAGPNAGHTVLRKNKTYKIRMLPSGFLNTHSQILIGPGVVINPDLVHDEIEKFDAKGRVFVDKNCGIIEQAHMDADTGSHLADKIGCTKSGTGPANADRAMRTLKLAKDEKSLENMLIDVPGSIHAVMSRGGKILVEGTQGTFLSLYHGSYPYVTSKDCTASSVCADVGIGPTAVSSVILVLKSFVTRVAAGPLRNEINAYEAEKRGWTEYGTVTGRLRRTAPMDYDLVKRSIMLNGATEIALTKIDTLFPECAGITLYDELSKDAKTFIEKLEKIAGIPVSLIGTGQDESDIIDKRNKIKTNHF